MRQVWLELSVRVSRVFDDLCERLRPEPGQTMAEYAILLGVIALVVVAVAVLLGKSISSIFSDVAGRT